MGKAYAHFAVGEYMNSSACLMRAFESSDKHSEKKVDVAALIGNKKLYQKRLAKLEVLYKEGGFYDAGEYYDESGYYKAAFLLAYLSCENGDLNKAKEYIDSAGAQMRQSNAWKSLRDLIKERLAITD